MIENHRATPQLVAESPEWFYVRSNRNESGGGVVTKSAVTISVDGIVDLKGKLAVLPCAPTVPTQTPTRMAAVAAIAPELLELRRKGWGLEALAAYLAEQGLPITPATLKNYLQRAGATRSKRRRRKGSPSAAIPPRTKATPPSAGQVPATPPAVRPVVRPVESEGPLKYGTFAIREDSKDL